jgi:hypothetical protein
MKMKKKIIFLIVFVPVHILLTMYLMQWYIFNYDADALFGGLLRVLAFVCSLPILLPFVMSDWAEYWPLPLQLMPFIANSLLWGIAILAVSGGVKRLRGKKQRMQTLQPT